MVARGAQGFAACVALNDGTILCVIGAIHLFVVLHLRRSFNGGLRLSRLVTTGLVQYLGTLPISLLGELDALRRKRNGA